MRRRKTDIESLARNLVAIDGIARTGKSTFSNILPSLDNFEHIQFDSSLESVLAAVYVGQMTIDCARILTRMHLNERFYNLFLSRDVNFRYGDQTGIFNYKEPHIYFKRLARKEGDTVVDELRRTKRFVPFLTHDLLVRMNIFEKFDIDYRVLELFRHPIDTCYSWWKRGWGQRFGRDPRAFTFCFDWKGSPVPWYCYGYEEEWVASSPVERCVLMVTFLMDKSVKQYNKLHDKKRIHILTFEDFVQRPDDELNKICIFLKTKTTAYTAPALAKARCPREIDERERGRKLAALKNRIRKKTFNRLVEMSAQYESNLFGLR